MVIQMPTFHDNLIVYETSFQPGFSVHSNIHSAYTKTQKYIDNIYKASEDDFIKSSTLVYGSSIVEIGGGEKLKATNESKK